MHCHQSADLDIHTMTGNVALVGHPNVGKSVIFQRLTGQRVIVSNYPGTTVEITRGAFRQHPQTVLVDTPGVVAFPPFTEDEQVTARVLFDERLKAILQVGDAKNLRRTLLLSVQLAEMGLPLVLALNMMDEAQARGVQVDYGRLAEALGALVVPTIAVQGKGMDELDMALGQASPADFRMAYSPPVEKLLDQASDVLAQVGGAAIPFAPRALALLWLAGDALTESWLRETLAPDRLAELEIQRSTLQESLGEPIGALIQRERLRFIDRILSETLIDGGETRERFSSWLGRTSMHPLWGWGIFFLAIYALYWFVGVFGAGVLVGLLEENLFGGVINPWFVDLVGRLLPFPFLVDLLVGEYGLWTMGITYAVALILPIVTTFFLAFGVMEDSGYLPRLAALSNRFFQTLGLNGKAVLPMVLGLGCVTMGTLTARVLESKRERVLVTLLLALAVPCSAQLGVVMGMLAGISFGAVVIWSGVVLLVLLAVGWLAARLVPGERNMLLVELPPLRWPQFSNVIIKTLARLEWYLKEVVPLFLLGALLMFALDKTGVLAWLMEASKPLVAGWLGLPAEASAAFLMGFLRRDFGATGLFVMEAQGLLAPVQVVVAMVTVTLFIPCVASVMMIAKERDWRTALGMVAVIFPLAFLVGGVLNRTLLALGWGL